MAGELGGKQHLLLRTLVFLLVLSAGCGGSHCTEPIVGRADELRLRDEKMNGYDGLIEYKMASDGKIVEFRINGHTITKGFTARQTVAVPGMGLPASDHTEGNVTTLLVYYLNGVYWDFYFDQNSGQMTTILVDGGY